MNRRGFLSLLGMGVAGIALEQAIPLGRVWSFPKEIVIAALSEKEFEDLYIRPAAEQLVLEAFKMPWISAEALEVLEKNLLIQPYRPAGSSVSQL